MFMLLRKPLRYVAVVNTSVWYVLQINIIVLCISELDIFFRQVFHTYKLNRNVTQCQICYLVKITNVSFHVSFWG